MAPSTPPPPSKVPFAAFTMASTFWAVISPTETCTRWSRKLASEANEVIAKTPRAGVEDKDSASTPQSFHQGSTGWGRKQRNAWAEAFEARADHKPPSYFFGGR